MENIGSFAGENTSCNFLSESTAGIKSTATQIWQLQAIVPQKKLSTAWNFGQFF